MPALRKHPLAQQPSESMLQGSHLLDRSLAGYGVQATLGVLYSHSVGSSSAFTGTCSSSNLQVLSGGVAPCEGREHT